MKTISSLKIITIKYISVSRYNTGFQKLHDGRNRVNFYEKIKKVMNFDVYILLTLMTEIITKKEYAIIWVHITTMIIIFNVDNKSSRILLHVFQSVTWKNV